MLKRYSAVAAGLLLLGTMSLVGCESTRPSSVGQSPAQSLQPSIADIENTAIIKSPNDDRQYSAILLPNGLQAVLVTDPASEVAAVSLAVGVGSYQDPDSQLGLAHYLEFAERIHAVFRKIETLDKRGIKLPRVGFGYRFGEGLSVYRVVFGSPY